MKQKNPIKRGLEKRLNAIRNDLNVSRSDFLVLDVESTGLGDLDEVIEICIVDGYGRVVLNSLIKPTCAIDPKAMAVHGIRPEALESSPTWNDIKEAYELVIKGKVLISYNSDFDKRIINQSYSAHSLEPQENEWKCAMKSYAKYFGRKKAGRYRYQKLTNALKQLGIEMTGPAHRAESDTRGAFSIVEFLIPN